MNRFWVYLALLPLMTAQPVWAVNGSDEEPQDTKIESSQDNEKDEESPIPRLAELRLDEYVVSARMINLPLPGKTKTMQEILDRLDEWSKDKQIGGALLDVGMVRLSLPDVEELRAALKRFKSADKKLMAFLNASTPQGYMIARVADEIAVAPSGFVLLPGIGSLFPFMKGHYQMLGLEFDVISAGRYKYPGFINKREPNEYFLEEFNTIFDSWIGDYKRMIAGRDGLTCEKVDEIVDQALFRADEAQQRGLVDVLAYQEEYRDRLLRAHKMRRYRETDKGLAGVNSIQGLMELINEELRRSEEARKAIGPKLAVLHARGPIVDINLGAAFASRLICRDDFVKVVDELRKNKSIKAVVMRVDSPGGSGYASDVIWQALRALDREKPLVVSMGTVAGSGGYYIACPARRIIAQPTTITGSIGVLGVFQCAQSAFNRMDYELEPMKRGARALLGAPNREMDKKDRQFIQDYIDDFYSIFIDRVAQTRKIPASEVRKIAEGRIYTGRQAIELRLVDELGGLTEAIQAARELASIPPSAEVKIVHYPRPSSLGEIFESFSSVGVTAMVDVLARIGAPATPMPFDQQLSFFAQRIQPLCWLAMPEFYLPQPVSAVWPGTMWQGPLVDPTNGALQQVVP